MHGARHLLSSTSCISECPTALKEQVAITAMMSHDIGMHKIAVENAQEATHTCKYSMFDG